MWWLVSAVWACDRVEEAGAFVAEVDAAWDEAAAGRSARAREQVLVLEPRLGCLSSPLSPEQAARFHLVEAARLSHEGDARGASAAVAAASALAPDQVEGWLAGVTLVEGLPPMTGGSSEGFAMSLAARVFVDGVDAMTRPSGLPVVVQIFTPSGAPVAGGWVDGRDPLPSWVAFPPATCPEEITSGQLVTAVDEAGVAYADLDVDRFERALHAVASGIPCLTDRVGLSQAAAIHRLEGIRLFVRGAEGAAVRSFQQAHALMPGYTPPESLVPPGSTLSQLWELAGRAAPSPWLLVDVPDGMALTVDGLEASQRPASTPAIVQVHTPSRRVLLSRFVPPGADLPDLDALIDAARAAELDRLSPAERLYREEGERHRIRNRRVLVAAGGVALLTASGALFVDNAFANQEYRDPETPHTRLAGLQRRANATATASALLLIGGTGVVTAAAFVR